jgi:excisionase family DNA binding protein
MEDFETRTYTVDQAAKILGIGRSAAYEAVRTSALPSVRVSPRRIVIPRAAIAKLLGEDQF